MTNAPALDIGAACSREGLVGSLPLVNSAQLVASGALRWHVRSAGRGARVLLLHGTGSAAESWARLIPLLADRFQVLAPDLPGHGCTSALPPGRSGLDEFAAAVNRLVADRDERPDIIVGHSAGAAIAVRMALDDPRVAVLALNGALRPLSGWTAATFVPLARLLGTNALVARLAARMVVADPHAVPRLLDATGSHIDAGMLALYAGLLRRPEHVAGTLRMLAHWDLRALVPRLDALGPRLTLVAGAADRIVAPRDALWVHQRVPGSRLLVLPALGHLAHEETPAAIANIVAELARDRVVPGHAKPDAEAAT